MSKADKVEWDLVCFVSHISVEFRVQIVAFDKKNSMIRLEDGFLDLRKVEIPFTEIRANEVEQCFESMDIYSWSNWNYNQYADGEQWTFEFFKAGESVLLKTGSNAYPEGYGKWIDFYSGLFKDNGIMEVSTCYQKEREGYIFYKE